MSRFQTQNNLSQTINFHHIATDGNLIPNSIQTNKLRLAVAERSDIIIDFSQFAPGTQIYLENRLEQKDGRGPTNKILNAGQGNYLMRFDVVLPNVTDASAVLAALPIRLQGNPGEGFTDRLAPTRRADIMVHADAAFHDEEFKSAIKRIRERKDRERAEKQGEAARTAPTPLIP